MEMRERFTDMRELDLKVESKERKLSYLLNVRIKSMKIHSFEWKLVYFEKFVSLSIIT